RRCNEKHAEEDESRYLDEQRQTAREPQADRPRHAAWSRSTARFEQHDQKDHRDQVAQRLLRHHGVHLHRGRQHPRKSKDEQPCGMAGEVATCRYTDETESDAAAPERDRLYCIPAAPSASDEPRQNVIKLRVVRPPREQERWHTKVLGPPSDRRLM